MAGLSKSAVKKLILKMIGGSPLQQVPTTTIAGSPVAAQTGAMVGAAAGAAAAVAAAAKSAGNMASGLSVLSKNPLASTITATKSQLASLTTGGFSGLDSAIPTVSGNPALSDSYAKLKHAIGGADGISGATAQVNKFGEHTDRLSGLLPSSEDA